MDVAAIDGADVRGWRGAAPPLCEWRLRVWDNDERGMDWVAKEEPRVIRLVLCVICLVQKVCQKVSVV